MTLHARKALCDLIIAHEMLERETIPNHYRIIWISAITLSRTIGQVLDKVDSKLSNKLKAIIDEEWEKLKESTDSKNAIFHDFIKIERDILLKEYKDRIYTDNVDLLYQIDEEVNYFELDECLFCPISYGNYAGEDGRDVIAEIIEWWDKYLKCNLNSG